MTSDPDFKRRAGLSATAGLSCSFNHSAILTSAVGFNIRMTWRFVISKCRASLSFCLSFQRPVKLVDLKRISQDDIWRRSRAINHHSSAQRSPRRVDRTQMPDALLCARIPRRPTHTLYVSSETRMHLFRLTPMGRAIRRNPEHARTDNALAGVTV